MKYYAGIGSRKTPKEILDLMSIIGEYLQSKRYILRSGGAIGADTAFEKYVLPENKEIFYKEDACEESYKYVDKYHPRPYKLTKNSKDLLARNTYQVLGKDFKTKSDFVICWTEDGCDSHSKRTRLTGGTGQAISIADDYNITVYNLANVVNYNMFVDLLKGDYNIHCEIFKDTYLNEE